MIYIRNTAAIALGTNIGFVTTDLHAKYRVGPADEIPLACSECDPCRINCICALRMRNTAEIALGTNIGFVIDDLHTKYCRNRIGYEHRSNH